MTQGFDEFYGGLELQCLNTQEVGELCFEAGAASRQAEIDSLSTLNEMSEQKIDDLVLRNIELQKRIDEALRKIEEKQDDSWKKWKESADMMEQGASNAYEVSYWILKGDSNE